MNLGDDTFFDSVSKNLHTNLKICSFSERNDSLLMWSHYALNHTGFCLEYRFTDLTEYPISFQIYPTHYTNEVFDMNSCIKSGLDLFSMAILSSINKHTDWQYEIEWRSFLWNRAIITQKIPAPIPTGIYFGAKSDISNRNTRQAVDFCLDNRIDMYQMKLATEKFELRSHVLTY